MPKLLLPTDQRGHALPVFSLGLSQNVSYNAAGGASTQSVAFGASTVAILLTTTTSDVRIAIGENPTANGTSTLVPKPAAMIFAVPLGGKIAVLGNDTGVGSVSVTELLSDPNT